LSIEFGLGVQGDRLPAEYARIASKAEDYGFDVLSVFSDFMYQPAIVPLLIAAQKSSRLRLGPACLNPFTLHPVEIAGQIASLDLASAGRAYLGLARGTWLDQAAIKQPRPLRALRECVEVVRRLLAADAGGYRGEIFSLSPSTRLKYQPLRADVPVMIGTWSRQTAALAGEIAAEVKIGGTTNPMMVRQMREWIEVGSQRIGRPSDAVGIVVGAVTVVDEDGLAARQAARSAVAMYVDVVGKLDVTSPVTGGRAVTDEILDRFAFAGTPAQVVKQTEALIDAGVKRIEFGAPFGLKPEAGLRLLGEQVLPALRHSR
jgi:5,10-methylenetetrahydromethanopterin reductase